MNRKIPVLLLAGALFFFTFQQGCEAMNKFTPPEGKTILIIGQDTDTFDNYVSDIGVRPAGFMSYISIQQMTGLYEPLDVGSGTLHLQYYIDKYPDMAVQIGLYMVDALEGTIEGRYDKNIEKLAKWLKGCNRPVFLRIGYEFDFPDNRYEPEKYVKAYRRIVDKLRAAGVDNTAYVWHSYISHIARPVTDWYPGDDYVDWFAMSYFGGRTKYMDSMAELAEKHGKPFMIAESSPHGIGVNEPWERWFGPFFKFISEKGVDAVSYINANWDAQAQWKDWNWKDGRVQANPEIKAKWLAEIKKKRYIHSSKDLYRIIGY